jgi:hypothetical protein
VPVNRTYLSNLGRASYPGLGIIAKLATVLEVEPAELPLLLWAIVKRGG